MANEEHLKILRKGVEIWNQWRLDKSEIVPDLTNARLTPNEIGLDDFASGNFCNVDFTGAFLIDLTLNRSNLDRSILSRACIRDSEIRHASLVDADLSESILHRADLSESTLQNANLEKARAFDSNFYEAILTGVSLRDSQLTRSNFTSAVLKNSDMKNSKADWASFVRTDFQGADLSGTNLMYTNMAEANLDDARLDRCLIYGASAWGVKVNNATAQSDLIITREVESTVTVDSLEVAQFIYLLMTNEKIREVINTVGQKAVLILGRFSPERKIVLDSLADLLRAKGFLPIIFDFDKSEQRDFTETIKILAGLSLFVIADITNPRSNPLELQATVPDYMIPFVPILQEGEAPFSMFLDLQIKYPWVLSVLEYDKLDNLLKGFEDGILKPALSKHDELVQTKNQGLKTTHIRDILKLDIPKT